MLDNHIPRPGRPDLRGWEWYYYLSLCHGEVKTFCRSSLPEIAAAWSPDDKCLAAAGEDGKIRVWDAATGQEVLTFSAGAPSWRVVWSPDGKRLASGQGHTVKVWDLAAERAIFTFGGFSKNTVCVAWSPKGERLVAGDWNGVIKVWDTATGKETLSFTDRVTAAVWSPDGKHLALGKPGPEGKDQIEIVDALTGAEVSLFPSDGDDLFAIAWSPDGKLLAASNWGDCVRVWDVATGRVVLRRRHQGLVGAWVWSPDGKRLAMPSPPQTVSIWMSRREAKSSTCKVIAVTFSFRPGVTTALAWRPSARTERSRFGTFAARHRPQHCKMCRTVALAWSPQGRRLIWAGGRKVVLWGAKGGNGNDLVRCRREDGRLESEWQAPGR